MRQSLSVAIAVILAVASLCTSAQQKKTVGLGAVKGEIRDTTNNYILKSATISIFQAKDSILLGYRITNNYGEFELTNLPINMQLKMEVSHVGYQSLHKSFLLTRDKPVIDFQSLIITPSDITLSDVTISVSPITVNGDTLEFNASAFKLDSNATAEDMLRAVPNITLWGDGTVTVNGAEIKSLKVNGKLFFGGNFEIALQNIPKNALQKIQVYKSQQSNDNPLDSTLEMNLKLKKGKDVGYFGKLSAGYGTNNRFETDLNLNIFSPKMQVAIVGASNNLNKTPRDIETIMSNSTFKGVGTRMDYQPDFRQSGVNRSNTTGTSFTYDFIEKPDSYKRNTLKAAYFLQNRNRDYQSELLNTTTLNVNNRVLERNATTSLTESTDQRFNSSYDLIKNQHNLRLSQYFNHDVGGNENRVYRTAENEERALTSINNTMASETFDNDRFGLSAEYRKSSTSGKRKELMGNFRANYQLDGYDRHSQRLNITEFMSFLDPLSNQKFNRKYNANTQGLNQQLDLELSNLAQTLFGGKPLGVDLSVFNKLSLNTNKEQQRVQDLDTLTTSYDLNNYLTNKLKVNVSEEVPGIGFSKSISNSLTNRYSKYTNINITLKQAFIGFKSSSAKAFQTLSRTYTRFVPDADLTYSNYQYGESDRYYSVSYNTKITIPTIEQLAPLTDSTNLYYLQRGNIYLKESIKRSIAFSFRHEDRKETNPFSYGFQISAGQIEDNIVDSILIDQQNRRIIYRVNANGNRYLNASLNLKKALKFKTSELQFNLKSDVSTAKNPSYTNGTFAFSRNVNTNSTLDIDYTYRNTFALSTTQFFNTYLSEQEAFNTRYSGKNMGTNLSSTYNLTKKLTLNTNITFNTSASLGSDAINFTIWNASVVYRFLKGNNAELKFSALDLLRQNTSVINFGTANSFTIGTQNVLRQYFMTTLSYYPRQFGKREKKIKKA
ncbi:outer membrane beta-barrel protein [Pedobacter sp. JCM 36344]|uniref:outer membrane beta-barrel protein n=1 Tax=Pedobacter sp. JCM 36344 TaxID=3374280 RepID=UPI003979CECA